jgi:hypothetical protein
MVAAVHSHGRERAGGSQDEAASFGDSLVLVTGTSLHPEGSVGLLKGTYYQSMKITRVWVVGWCRLLGRGARSVASSMRDRAWNDHWCESWGASRGE